MNPLYKVQKIVRYLGNIVKNWFEIKIKRPDLTGLFRADVSFALNITYMYYSLQFLLTFYVRAI